MLFKKKNTWEEEKKSLVGAPKRGIKKMDALVTGLIFWWVVASIYGVKKWLEKKDTPEVKDQLNLFEEPEKKRWFWRRLFSRKK